MGGLSLADCADDPAVPPLPVDPAHPAKDIYGNASWPGVDGVDVWPLLTNGTCKTSPQRTAAQLTAAAAAGTLLMGAPTATEDPGCDAHPDGLLISAQVLDWT
jgi:hypothetical protein